MLSANIKILRWTLNHKFKAIGALLFLMLLLRLVWGWSVHRNLRSQLQAIRVRGEPIDVTEVRHQALPDEQNAVVLYRNAVATLNEHVDCPRNSNLEYADYFPRQSKWMELAEASEKAQAPAFALVRAARQRPRAQFATSFPDEAQLRYLTQLRELTNIINDGAEYAHLHGDDVEAIERLLDALHLSRALAADDFLISYMVAIGIDASACHSIMLIAPDLSAPPPKIRELIHLLLDENDLRAAQKRVFVNERVRQIHSYARSDQRYWLLAPLAEQDLVRELPNLQLLIEAADAPDFAQAAKILQRCHWDHPPQSARFIIGFPANTIVPRYSRWFYDGLDYSPHIERFYRIFAERRLAATALACQLYRADHGQFPQRLDQLVPKYLPAVPADPFFSDGRPIGYAIKTHAPPLSGPRPMVYFDPGGPDVAPRAEPISGWVALPIRGEVRQYRDISRFIPASPKAVNNNPNQSNAPGEDSKEDKSVEKP